MSGSTRQCDDNADRLADVNTVIRHTCRLSVIESQRLNNYSLIISHNLHVNRTENSHKLDTSLPISQKQCKPIDNTYHIQNCIFTNYISN